MELVKRFPASMVSIKGVSHRVVFFREVSLDPHARYFFSLHVQQDNLMVVETSAAISISVFPQHLHIVIPLGTECRHSSSPASSVRCVFLASRASDPSLHMVFVQRCIVIECVECHNPAPFWLCSCCICRPLCVDKSGGLPTALCDAARPVMPCHATLHTLSQHLFKMLFRLLECHHDLRGRLAHWECDAVEADVIVREVHLFS